MELTRRYCKVCYRPTRWEEEVCSVCGMGAEEGLKFAKARHQELLSQNREEKKKEKEGKE